MTNTRNAEGWAVAVDDQIDMRTAGPTSRGAAVNWLYCEGYAVTNSMSDDDIVDMFVKVKPDHVRLVAIKVEEARDD